MCREAAHAGGVYGAVSTDVAVGTVLGRLGHADRGAPVEAVTVTGAAP